MKTSAIRKIALGTLRLAPENVRKTNAPESSDAELLASIRAHGVRQNLGVYDGGDGFFYVHAGGRRLRALQTLATEGAVAADLKVNCVVDAAADATELSLVENVVRAAMHPADEYDAFAALEAAGHGEDEIARRFGVSVLHVRRRLRLAAVAPELIAAYRADEMKLDALMAFTLTDSHERQREVWELVRPHLRYGGSIGQTIRQHLTDTRLAASSRLGMFVGVEAYEAAGGTVTRDLFAERDSVFFDDPGLVQRLVLEKLEAEAETLRADWRWIEVMIDMPWDAAHAYGRVYPERAEPDAELVAELEAVQRSLAELTEALEEDEREPTAEEVAELEGLKEREEELEVVVSQTESSYPPAARSIAGGILSLNYDGTLRFEAGLVRADDYPVEPEQTVETDVGGESAGADGESSAATDGADGEINGARPAPATPVATPMVRPVRIDPPRGTAFVPGGEPKPSDPNALSESLTLDLRSIRHQLVQAHLASDFATSFDLVVFSMCASVFVTSYRAKPIDITVTKAFVSQGVRPGTVADAMLEALQANLNLDWLGKPEPDDFTAFRALKDAEKQALFAFCAAHGVRQQLSTDRDAVPAIEVAGAAMGIDVAENWRPTASIYFGRVKKEKLLATARETIDDAWAYDHAGGRKADLARAMELAFAGGEKRATGLSPEQAERAGGWLPAGMGFAADAALPDAEAHRADADEAEAEIGSPAGGDVVVPAFLIGANVKGATDDDQDLVDEYGESVDPHFAVAAE